MACPVCEVVCSFGFWDTTHRDVLAGLVERSVDVIQGLQSRAATLISQKLGEILSEILGEHTLTHV